MRPAAPHVLLRTSDLVKDYHADGGVVRAVRGVSLMVDAGEFVAIMGPSGSGKSTLLHVIGGLEPPTSGQIWLDGQRADRLSPAAWAVRRRRGIGIVFQAANLLSTMTVADNVELPALLAGATTRQARARREELLEELGLAAKARTAPTPVGWRAAEGRARPRPRQQAQPAAGRRADREPGQHQHY
jgi:putative ABC transport system ATP-binding protein